MDDAALKTNPQRRKLPRDARRVQLMDATIEVLADRGYARTTLTEIANQAGLSHGLVTFYFQTKEKLLTETLLYLAEEYRQNWLTALYAAGPSPAERLDALFRADFNVAFARLQNYQLGVRSGARRKVGPFIRNAADQMIRSTMTRWKQFAPNCFKIHAKRPVWPACCV